MSEGVQALWRDWDSYAGAIGIEAKQFVIYTSTVVSCAAQVSGVRALFSRSLNMFALLFISHIKQRWSVVSSVVLFFCTCSKIMLTSLYCCDGPCLLQLLRRNSSVCFFFLLVWPVNACPLNQSKSKNAINTKTTSIIEIETAEYSFWNSSLVFVLFVLTGLMKGLIIGLLQANSLQLLGRCFILYTIRLCCWLA